jgi:PAS domain S-box-containing protein
VVVTFDLLIVAFAMWTLSWSRGQYLENAKMGTNNLAQVLEENVHGTVKKIDLVLLSIKDEAERWKDPDRDRRIDIEIQSQFNRIQMLDGLRTADEDGFIDRGTAVQKTARVSIQDRDYYQFLKANPTSELFVSRPVIGRVSGKWVIILARRLNHPDGRFAGVVYGTITVDQLGSALASVDVGKKGSISLRGADRGLLARFPKYPGFERTIGETKVDGDYLEAAESGRPVSHFTAKSWIDGQTRTYAFRRTANPTFFILVGLAQSDYLQAWRKEALLAVSAVSGLIILSLSISFLGRSAWRRQVRDSAILEAQEAKFRLLAENASDVIWTADPNGTITYISPGVTKQRGYTPEALTGINFSDPRLMGSQPDRLHDLLDRARRAHPGSQPFEGEWLEVELPKQDAGHIKVEIRIRLVWDEYGNLRGFQGVTRDITERARMEAERDNLIRQLRLALAEVKNLEGMLPICGQCKKIRDDRGYWNNLESYISEHSDATFTHGVCPDCAEIMRQDIRDRRSRERRENEENS